MELPIFYFFICFPLLSSTNPLEGCQKSVQNECNELESKETAVNSPDLTENPNPEKRLMENFLGDLYSTKNNNDDEDDLRTWRLNQKALVPILIGLAVKSLAMVGLSLTGLTLLGSIAIFLSKVSLTISTVMFLKRFFSHDHSSGGFFGLNPLGFPHLPHNDQATKHRRIMNVNNNMRRQNYEEIIGSINKYRGKFDN